MSLYDQHSVVNPIGTGDVICESQGHDWQSIWFQDHHYRYCRRCDRMERRDGHGGWEVNVIYPTAV